MSFGGQTDATDAALEGTEGAYQGASALQSRLAQESNRFSRNYFNRWVKPVLPSIMNGSNRDVQRIRGIAADAQEYQRFREEQFRSSIDVAGNFLQTVRDTDHAAYGEQMKQTAFGDIANQAAQGRDAAGRALAARGVDQTSGAAVSGLYKSQMDEALYKARAANQINRLVEDRKFEYQKAGAQYVDQMESWAQPYMQMAGNASAMATDTNNSRINALATAHGIRTSGINTTTDANQLGVRQQGWMNALDMSRQDEMAETQGFSDLVSTVAGVGLSLNPATAPAGLAMLGGTAKA